MGLALVANSLVYATPEEVNHGKRYNGAPRKRRQRGAGHLADHRAVLTRHKARHESNSIAFLRELQLWPRVRLVLHSRFRSGKFPR